jgi:hypothetical protein
MPYYKLKTDESLPLGYFLADSPEEAEVKFRHTVGRLLKKLSEKSEKRVLASRLSRNDFEVIEYKQVVLNEEQ